MTYAVPSRTWVSRALRVVALAVVAVLTLSSCKGAYDLPLPGGAKGDGPSMRIKVDFADVLDLVPKSAVKINDLAVGQVEEIELNGWTARVTLSIPKSTKLPDNATAELKQSSLLGEKYVALSGPLQGESVGQLSDGDLIPIDRTNRNPEVEEVLSAMSLLLNGGGIAQLGIIERELNNALRGNTDEIKSLIGQLNTFIGGLEAQKAEIVRAIDMVDVLSARLAAQKDLIAKTLQEMPKGLKVLADQRIQLTQMLQALSRLGAVGTKVIQGSKEDTLANLKALAPILTQLNKAGDNLPKSLELLLTYPFPDGVLDVVKGDYANLAITMDLDLSQIKILENGLPGGAPLPDLAIPGLPVPVPSGGAAPRLPGVTPSLPVPAPTAPANPLCPPLCASDSTGRDTSWTTLYGGGGA
ncbi:phospholipid/cholesterol/gamma-HCH transport system substrate-binding protein [Knoellia remsis]|uniref:Phospholipid/cholesterol/gamma-HCH transport system substrate-binding protein n=1 Tax=Knoellia remsis TaxID=407159 RepID=A0A2T0UI13_9MICO|nr:MCE family protein [Knoellia remsis]PRY57508.1 phospholipid/cholesterol/gamma-HCH transport system substrate-binding protein [Knoellia remsis]